MTACRSILTRTSNRDRKLLIIRDGRTRCFIVSRLQHRDECRRPSLPLLCGNTSTTRLFRSRMPLLGFCIKSTRRGGERSSGSGSSLRSSHDGDFSTSASLVTYFFYLSFVLLHHGVRSICFRLIYCYLLDRYLYSVYPPLLATGKRHPV